MTSKSGWAERCPTCTSNDKSIRYITAIPVAGVIENAKCSDPWHDAPPAASTGTPADSERIIQDAAMLLRRCIHRLRKSPRPGDQTIAMQAYDWLKRQGLEGTVLRQDYEGTLRR